MDNAGSLYSPVQIINTIQNAASKSAVHTSSSSSSSPSSSSCVYVQSLEDVHFSPKALAPKLSKPVMNGIVLSKSDTDSNRVSRESMKFNNESFGSPTPDRRYSEKNKPRPGTINRTSRFSERLHATSKTSKASDTLQTESREIKSKIRLSIQADIEKEPIPSLKADDLSPNSKSGFFKKRPAMVLTPGQLDMINDKVTKAHAGLQRQRSFSVNLEKPKVGRSKLLQRISNIAARGSITGYPAGEPAVIFKQLLKKVNPESLHKAEKEMKRRYIRKIWDFCKACAKVPFEILTPEDFFTIFWTVFILVVVLYDSFVKPFEVCFYAENRRDLYMEVSAIITVIIFSIDICFNFRTAFYNKGVLVTESSAIVKEYLNNNFKYDIIVVIADYLSLASTEDGVWHLKLLSIIRFKKLLDLIIRTEDFLNLSRTGQASLKLVKLWGTIILVAHWIACFFHLIAYMQMDTDITWLHNKGLTNASIAERYVAAIYWSILTMVTVGYGDIAPVSIYERMYAILAMMIASAIFGYSMSTVASIINEISYEKDQRKEKISNVNNYMNQKNLGKNVQTRVKNYIQYIIDSRALYRPDEEQFMDLLSQNLKDEIVSEVNGKILAGSQMFSVNFSHKAALNLAKFMKETFLAPEEIVFEEGDKTDYSIYFIAYGKIQLYHKVKEFNVLEKGSQFGEIAFFSGQARSASAKSLFFSNLYSLARDVALENINAVPSDFEMFHYIKDRININLDYSLLDLTCFSCQRKGHMAKECDKIHYVPQQKEVIDAYIERQNRFRKMFRRNIRPRFNARMGLAVLDQAAQMMQEDYSDFTLSDEELSQDSLDVILERNLILLPGAEMNDLKVRKLERRNKSHRYSVQAFMGEFAGGGGSSMLPRFSHLSQNVTKEESEARASFKMAPSEIAFFTIDKVENFEVYYPQFNIRTMIQRFEKERVQQMLKGNKGGAKAIVLKNFGSLLRDKNRRGTIMPPNTPASPSPMYFAKSSFEKKQTLRGRRTIKNDQSRPDTGLKNQMFKAIVKAKTIKKLMHKNTGKTFEEDGVESNRYSTPVESSMKSPFDVNESYRKKLSSDEATMSRKETYDDKKTIKSKQRVFNFETLGPHTMGQLKLDRSESHSHALASSTRAIGGLESPGNMPNFTRKSKTKESSKKGTIIQQLLTRHSLDDRVTIFDLAAVKNEEIEHALLHAMIKEEYSLTTKTPRKRRRGRAYSLERLDSMKKAITKFKMPKIIKGFMDSGPAPKTAVFGI